MVRLGYTLSMMRRPDRPYPDWELIRDIKRAGFDYVELPLSSLVAMEDAEFAALQKLLEENEILCETVNMAVPAGMKIVGPDTDAEAEDAFLEKAAEVFHALSAKRVVFGAASAKNVPEGFPEKRAFEQTVSFLRRFSAKLHPEHELIAIEPINRKEANFITNLSEGMALVTAVDRGNVGLCVDYYHMAVEEESMAALKAAGKHVVQLHFCHTDRSMPLEMDAGMKAFLKTIQEMGYEKRMTFEAKCSDPAQFAPAVNEVRKYL